MSRLSAFTLTALMLLTAACRDPRCPTGFVQDGVKCWRCPEGSAVKNNQCVDPDGDVVDPIMGGDDEDAQVDEGTDEPDGSQADASGILPERDASGADPSDASMDSAVDGASAEASVGPDGSAGGAAGDSDAAASGPDASVDAGPPCYADNDKDGVGAGAPVSCEGIGSDAGPSLSMTNTDCDDNNNKRSPSLTDICGDNIDNDCDGTPDDEANNACGGPCTTQLAHQPGEKCDNGLKGACAKDGTWQCQGKTATVCNAPSVAAGAEVCGDGVDNDCDGRTDEEDAIDATTWYEDCDGDGYSALTDALIAAKVGTRMACSRPAPTTPCAGGWTAVRPQAPLAGVSPRNWDCDDSTGAYRPGMDFGFPPPGKTNTDLDCSGASEKEPAIGIIDGFWQVITPVKACSAVTDCTSCANSGGRGQWLAEDKSTPTDTPPTCSVSMDDVRPWRSIDWANNIGRCPMNQYFNNWYAGWQRCR